MSEKKVKVDWKRKYLELSESHSEDMQAHKRRLELVEKAAKQQVKNAAIYKDRNSDQHTRYVNNMADVEALKEQIEFWRKRSQSYIAFTVQRGAVRAKYDQAYEVFRDYRHAGAPLSSQVFVEILSKNPRISMIDLAHIFEEFGLTIPQEVQEKVQNSRAQRSTINIKDEKGKLIQSYSFDIDARVAKEDIDAALESIHESGWNTNMDITNVTLASIEDKLEKLEKKDLNKEK